MESRPVLVVQHEAACPPGRLLTWAADAGTTLDVRACHRGDPLPATLEGHSALIVLDGPMGVYDEPRVPWLVPTTSLVIQSVLHGVPFLGLCLGHQLAGLALGGRVEGHPYGRRRGVGPVGPSPEAASDPLMLGVRPGDPLIECAGDVLSEAPGGSVVLSRDRWGQIQSIRYGDRAWGIEGHPEADVDIVAAWGEQGACASGTAPRDEEAVLGAVRAADERMTATWSAVAVRFFALAAATRAFEVTPAGTAQPGDGASCLAGSSPTPCAQDG